MKYILVSTYAALFYLCSLNVFAGADFMLSIFFASSACILCALIASYIDDLFAEFFMLLQALALITYASVAVSYSFFDSYGFLVFEQVNSVLLIIDIVALAGVLLGDKWVYNKFS